MVLYVLIVLAPLLSMLVCVLFPLLLSVFFVYVVVDIGINSVVVVAVVIVLYVVCLCV